VSAAVADLELLASGKVRDIYSDPAHPDRLLLIASDRVSTYDAVHPTPIPGKGAVLTALSTFWLEQTAELVPNHFVSVTHGVPAEVRGRAMVVKKLDMLAVEAVVRGYLSGSAWTDYQARGTVSGIRLRPGLRESDQLAHPIFTPSTKAGIGHDEAIGYDRAVELIGSPELTEAMAEAAISIYSFAAALAAGRGIILADTKFEFGLDARGVLTLGDEVCTPDSSRFWPADAYAPGRPQASFDKQFVRDWATGTGWDKLPPAPVLPADVVAQTQQRYIEAYEAITGAPFSAWLKRTGAPQL
jgi:phosphoribosylaminoimidazole-succinocarboxamide synthase